MSYSSQLFFSATLVVAASIGYPKLGVAQTASPTHNDSQNIPIHFQQQNSDGSSRGRPGRREGTGSRGDCPPVETQLTALIPSSHFGSFVESHPSLWFYIPYQSSEVALAEFSLQDEQNHDIYRTRFSLPETPGIVRLNLSSAPPLAIHQKYQWYVKIYCSQQNLSTPIFIRGWVERVVLPPDLERQLQATRLPRQRIALYAQQGIWYSALAAWVQLQSAEPQNPFLAQDFANLLRDIGLENLMQKPLVGEVKLQGQ